MLVETPEQIHQDEEFTIFLYQDENIFAQEKFSMSYDEFVFISKLLSLDIKNIFDAQPNDDFWDYEAGLGYYLYLNSESRVKLIKEILNNNRKGE